MTANRINPERLLAQAGGVSGVIYSSLPVVVFVIASSVSGLVAAIAAALGVAALVLLWRLVRRDSPQPAISGFFGVALCALIAYVVGESKGYFLLGIWMSLLWAVVVAASVLIRRPLVGYAWSWAGGRGDGWRSVPRAVYAFDVASLCWVLVFAARFVVQGLLYDADRTGWLAAARIGMG
ncbi:membrane protein, partial [Mycobacterium avium subsp. paratuberculosis 10-8425]